MIDNSPLFALIAEEKLLKVYKVLQSSTVLTKWHWNGRSQVLEESFH